MKEEESCFATLGFGPNANSTVVDVRKGKVVRIRPLLIYKGHLSQCKGIELIAFRRPVQIFAQGDDIPPLGPDQPAVRMLPADIDGYYQPGQARGLKNNNRIRPILKDALFKLG